MPEESDNVQIRNLLEFLESIDPETGLTVSHALHAQVVKEQDDADAFWNGLTKEQQLQAFCAVVKRIHDGEMKQRRSFRGVLYGVFGFGPNAYAPAMYAGYMDIHNALVTRVADREEAEKNEEDRNEDQAA
jgi:hypothetical protein